MKRLISFVGTGDYQETMYDWQGAGKWKSRYVAESLARIWGAEEVVLLATKKAFDMHQSGIINALDGYCKPQFRIIEDGGSEEALWNQFDALRQVMGFSNVCKEENEILLDITHGFRAQPFFAGAVIAVVRSTGRFDADIQLTYGEWRRDDQVSPIWDLTLFIQLLDWAQALELFTETGVVEPIVRLGEKVRRRLAREELKYGGHDFPRFEPLVKALKKFGDDLATLRIAAIVTGFEQQLKERHKARGSALNLQQEIDACQEEISSRLPPLSLILDRIRKMVTPIVSDTLFGDEGLPAQQALARLYLDFGRLPEAAVVAREGWINRIAESHLATDVNNPEYCDHLRSVADQLLGRQLGRNELIEIRNDLQHGGFRAQPKPAASLIEGVRRIVSAMDAPLLPADTRKRGHTWFVSRHPGALQWAEEQGIIADRQVAHLNIEEVSEGDTVIGTLPIHLAAAVCSRGAVFHYLALEIPRDLRGYELSAEQLIACNARLINYHVHEGEQEIG